MPSNSFEDPYSFARPELARVTKIDLELNVDFNKRVLKGKAILTIEKSLDSVKEVILDKYNLLIERVTNPVTGKFLPYNTIESQHSIGSQFTIILPPTRDNFGTGKQTCVVQIEYETSPNCPALYWLTPEQTADSTHPFLMSNNKLTYARAVFPCQDTPSVKFSYTAKISVPKDFTVIMSALLPKVSEKQQLWVYEFFQTTRVPSYAVIIVAGYLQKAELTSRSKVFVENKYFIDSIKTFKTGTIERMLEIAESLCGPYCWDRFDICVLPPSIGYFYEEIECPCVTFVSPILLRTDHTIISMLARSIAQSWAGHLVTCSNYNDLWLNQSISMFISRKIICQILKYEQAKLLLERRALIDLNIKVSKFGGNNGLLNSLIPDLKNVLPIKAINYVPYEVGCVLLGELENMVGGPSAFESFLKSYFYTFANKSIQTDDWFKCLYNYFPEKKEMLNSIKWHDWFYTVISPPVDLPMKTTWETECFQLAQAWANWNDNVDAMPSILLQRRNFCDFQKIIFLHNLYLFHAQLNKHKIQLILSIYPFDQQSHKIRFVWLLLCIKVRWELRILPALNFAIQFCSPRYACPIFEHLFEWPEYRALATRRFLDNKEKMLHDTQKKLISILGQQ
ncbi:PREDICTED: leukotriene A-4 hydrolase [Wasmannia auropunctata]|uniref:leukotriene A-4 hydrolase n=1 Tax=Wasmannia auropunctata TaxID=64793 RepID=UPI0005F02B1F|nr:PREDICTED: leukotriene A-4 hydrolase [Wasmannia auropunctata]XP_011696168.1 PREDICTED: leukotriene A-4 hydrolase [Wasmannia auropunctata]XP_011696169.1 PREDICTED: leukotriene A-4 hydrolase [Wasmannia auropunctata]